VYPDLTFTYEDAPAFASASPAAAPADQDNLLTISGTGFTFGAARLNVYVGAQACTNITVLSATSLTCLLKASQQRFTGPVPITGYVTSTGNVVSKATFQPVHYWSRAATWASGAVPADGERVVVPAGMTVLLDSSTAALASLELRGSLVFDPVVPVVGLTAGSVLLNGARPPAAARCLLAACSPCSPATAALPLRRSTCQAERPPPPPHSPQAATCRSAPTPRPSPARPPSP
jgi:hypothetical protein